MAGDEDVNAAARNVNQAAKAWNKAARRRVKFQNRLELHPELKQVWFPGYHINIGGGSSATLKNEGDMEEMSNITFAWMLDQIKQHLSVDEKYIAEGQCDREKHLEQLNKDLLKWEASVKAQVTESWGDWTWRHAKAAVSAIRHPFTPSEEPAYKKPRAYGWGTGELKDSYTVMYRANGPKKRTPGEYALKDGKSLGETFEFIHPVVNFRREQFKEMSDKDKKHPRYNPIGPDVKYERRKVVDSDGNPYFEYDIGNTPKPLPEWKLGGLDSYERLVIAGEAAFAYVDDLDDQLGTGIRRDRRPVEPHDELPIERPLTTVFDCEFQSGNFQSDTVESKAFSTKVSKVEVSTREIAREESFSAVY